MKVILLAIFLLALCVVGLGFNIIFRKKGFPDYDVGSNEEMQKLGIRCYKEIDAELQGLSCDAEISDACKDCSLYEYSSDSRKA